jgi:protein involved in polysaccharide export with SLBB domain
MLKTRCNRIAALLGLIVVFSLPSGAGLAEDYRLGIADRVKIKVQEWPDMNGEYAVTPDGMVSLPLIGNINAIGISLNDLSKEISDRLQKRSQAAERALAAVEIAQYRPFAIIGDVQKPGQYPYHPGLTVLEAISIAGGYYRPEFGLLRLGRDAAIASGDANTLKIKLNRLLVHEARMSAAIGGGDDISLPPELANLKDDAEIAAIIKSEQAALTLENEMKRNERASLENIKSLYQNEITSLRGQVQALSEEKESIGNQLNQLRSMASRGLALTPTMFALERSFAQVSNEQMSTETAIVRANESITLADQRVTDLQQERGRSNSKDLQQTRDAIAETRAKIETAVVLLHEAQTLAPAEARERMSQDGERPHFIILRRNGDSMKEVAGGETTLVAPDDVIKVPSIRLPATARNGSISLSQANQRER